MNAKYNRCILPCHCRCFSSTAYSIPCLPACLPACLQLAEFNPLDADSFASVIKRGARVVLVVGDQVGGRAGGLRTRLLL